MKYSLRSLMIVALVLPPLLAALVYAASLVTPRRFAAETWKVDRNIRRLMIDDLMAKGSLRGKQEAEVREMLGEPDTSHGGKWLYEIRPDGIDYMWLELAFKNGKVSTVAYRPD